MRADVPVLDQRLRRGRYWCAVQCSATVAFLKNIFGKRSSGFTLATRRGDLPIELVDRGQAVQEWKRRVEHFPSTGKWPILLGPEDELERLGELEEEPEVVADLPNYNHFLADKMAELREFSSAEDLTVDATRLDSGKPGKNGSTIVSGVGNRTHKKVGIAEIPCKQPWEVLKVRPFGGWNGTPTDAELTSVLLHWYEEFGAVPLGLTRDCLELYLKEPVHDPRTAADLAVEMLAICPDVDQGPESLQNQAQWLLNSSIWFFWWD